MRKAYSPKLHEEALVDDLNRDIEIYFKEDVSYESSICPICGVYDEKIFSERNTHSCSPKVLHGINGTDNSLTNPRKIPFSTQLDNGFRMLSDDQQTI